jgi:DNA-binding beta-propeller fold protein YncE
MRNTWYTVLSLVWITASGCSAASKASGAAVTDAGDAAVDGHVDGHVKDLPDGPVMLPRGAPGIEFDDIQFGPGLRKVIVPAGRTGSVVLIDPDTSAMIEIKGLQGSDKYTPVPGTSPVRSGTRYGSTSATEAGQYVAALDCTAKTLNILDPAAATIVASVALGGASDYVHYVPSLHELWVTNPNASGIDLYSLPASGKPTPVRVGSFAVTAGPESLAIDEARGHAYTNTFLGGKTDVIDLKTKKVVETWSNGCVLSLGVTMDEARGFAFVSCGDSGDVVVLDAKNHGATLSRLNGGKGTNILAYSPSLKHVYSASGNTKEVFVMAVADSGTLTLLGRLPGADRGFSVAADDRGHVWVIDPDHGQILRGTDNFPVR